MTKIVAGSLSTEFGPYEELAIDEDPEFPNELKVQTFHYMCELIKYRTTLTDNQNDRKKAIEIFDKLIEEVKDKKILIKFGIKSGRLLFWALKDPIKQRFNDEEKIKIISYIANKLEIKIKNEKLLHRFGYLLRSLGIPLVGDFIADKLRHIEKEVLESKLVQNRSEVDYNSDSSNPDVLDSEHSSSGAETIVATSQNIEATSIDTPRNSVTLSRDTDLEDPEFPNDLKIKAFLFINDLVKIVDLENNPGNHNKMIAIFNQLMEGIKAKKEIVEKGLGFDAWPKSALLSRCSSDSKNYKLKDDEKIQLFDHIIKQVAIPIQDKEKLKKFTTLIKCLQLSIVKSKLIIFMKNTASVSQLGVAGSESEAGLTK
jgi:hypothetical protein